MKFINLTLIVLVVLLTHTNIHSQSFIGTDIGYKNSIFIDHSRFYNISPRLAYTVNLSIAGRYFGFEYIPEERLESKTTENGSYRHTAKMFTIKAGRLFQLNKKYHIGGEVFISGPNSRAVNIYTSSHGEKQIFQQSYYIFGIKVKGYWFLNNYVYANVEIGYSRSQFDMYEGIRITGYPTPPAGNFHMLEIKFGIGFALSRYMTSKKPKKKQTSLNKSE